MIDFRSDTVTLPPPEMLAAMSAAELGDDVFGDDPTVLALEAQAAALFGKYAALFVPSGTMGNLLATMTHTRPGDELICGRAMHTFTSEGGGAARLAGVSTRTVSQSQAALDPAEVLAAIRPDDAHCPLTALVWLEQPHNGWAMPGDNVAALVAIARERGLAVHMDGARIFNAAVALGRSVADLSREADTVMFCISKGLAAPVGSLLLGPAEFIHRARRNRKVVGGGLRQVGVLAAAGLYALDHMVARLADDHANAQALADGLRRLGWRVDREHVDMNIFFATLPDGQPADNLLDQLKQRDVLIYQPRAARTIRFVTHYGIEATDITHALDAIATLPA